MAAEDIDMNSNIEVVQGFASDPTDPPEPQAPQDPATSAQPQGFAPAPDQPPTPSPMLASPPRPTKPARKLPITPANLLLVGLVAAGAGCVYLLSLRNGPQTASAQEQTVAAQIDAALVQMQSPMSAIDKATSAVVDTFYYEAKQRQMPISMLSGNAFIYKPASMGGVTPARQSDQQIQAGADVYAIEAAKSLQLQCVMKGANGTATAMVSNALVTVGQVIKGWKVKSIAARDILLTRGGMEYVLRMPR